MIIDSSFFSVLHFFILSFYKEYHTLIWKYETFWPFLRNALFVKMTHRKREKSRQQQEKRLLPKSPAYASFFGTAAAHPRSLTTWLGVLILANLMIIICEASRSRRVVLFRTVFPTQCRNFLEVKLQWKRKELEKLDELKLLCNLDLPFRCRVPYWPRWIWQSSYLRVVPVYFQQNLTKVEKTVFRPNDSARIYLAKRAAAKRRAAWIHLSPRLGFSSPPKPKVHMQFHLFYRAEANYPGGHSRGQGKISWPLLIFIAWSKNFNTPWAIQTYSTFGGAAVVMRLKK